MSDLDRLKFLKNKLQFLGYKNGLEKVSLNKSYDPVIKELQKVSNYKMPKLEPLSLDEIKNDAIKFYEKYFDVHDIYYINEQLLNENRFNPNNCFKLEDAIKLSKDYYSLAKSISPFSLPIELVDGDAMTGEIRKPLIVISNEDYVNNTLSSEKRIIPFSKVLMGRDLTKLSSATYIHELAHAEQESVPGYTDSILNKEVISIFLEKIAALELDPTGELLKISERRRFADLLDTFRLLKLNEFTHTLSPEELLNNSIYIHSTLLAEKLFDLYLEERKQKKEINIFIIFKMFLMVKFKLKNC